MRLDVTSGHDACSAEIVRDEIIVTAHPMVDPPN